MSDQRRSAWLLLSVVGILVLDCGKAARGRFALRSLLLERFTIHTRSVSGCTSTIGPMACAAA